VGDGHLLLSVTEKIQVRRVAARAADARALTVTGAAQLGAGGATQNFGAVNGSRRASGHETSVT